MRKRRVKSNRIGTFLFSLVVSATCLGGICVGGLSTLNAFAGPTPSPPQLFEVSDAVKPGESITLQGAYLYKEGATTVLMAENQGEVPTTPPQNAIEITQFLSVDEGGEGVIFTFPTSLAAGEYDLWVRTSDGCSNAITLNASRPLYLNQEAAYEGLPIEIIGRNLLEHEYGVGDEASALTNAKVKLVSTTDGAKQYVVGVDNGVRYDTAQSVTGKMVTDSNPYRLTFTAPNVDADVYDVYVAANGEDFRGLLYPQTLEIVEKRPQSWNTDIFGEKGSAHIGNDPLGLQVYWAQALNYDNVERMTPFAAPPESVDDSSIDAFKKGLVSAVNRLKKLGGGVVYFPEGEYYLNSINDKSDGCIFENIVFVGDGADKTRIFYADAANTGTWIRTYASNVGFARMSVEQWDKTVATKRPDNPLAFFDTSSSDDIDKQETQNKFVTDVNFEFNIDNGNETGVNRRCYISVSGDKNVVFRNIDWYGGNTPFRSHVYRYVKVENMRAEFNGVGSASFECSSSYSTLENVSIKARQTEGHGYSCRGGTYIGNCYVANVGNIAPDGTNKGEAIMFEPPGGFFSTGTVAGATRNTVTTTRIGGNEVGTDTKLLYNNPAVYIIGGKGAGQMRFIKKRNDTVENLNANATNTYEFLDGEEDWDIIPDETSRFTIMAPQDGSTVYRFKAEHCLKGIYLYSQLVDTVVAECDMQDTEGIFLTSVANVSAGRINANANVRIVNNEIKGVSLGSNEGGIQLRVHAIGTAEQVLFGTATRNVVVRGNKLTDTHPTPDQSYSTSTEMMHYSGITVHTQIQNSLISSSVGKKVDFKLVVIENNEIDNGEYGVYSKAFAQGMVIRNNIAKSGADTKEAYSINTAWAPNVYFTKAAELAYVLDGGQNAPENPSTYEEGIVATLANPTKAGYTFDGWYTAATGGERVTQLAASSTGNVTLYARWTEIVDDDSTNDDGEDTDSSASDGSDDGEDTDSSASASDDGSASVSLTGVSGCGSSVGLGVVGVTLILTVAATLRRKRKEN